MIYDLVYHCRKGPTKVTLSYLQKALDTKSIDEIVLALTKLRVQFISITKGNNPSFVLEILN